MPPNPNDVKLEPLQRSTRDSPANHTSLEPEPHTESISSVPPPGIAVHCVPSKCRIVAATPTAQTSDALVAHRPRRLLVVPLSITVQLPATRRRIVPSSPTANTSSALIAHTA